MAKRLDINVKEAPISKVSIYRDHIDIITGKKNEQVLRKFDITSKLFLEKYTSLPDFINNMFNDEVNNTYFFLEGLSSSPEEYTPTDEEYDTFTFKDYFDKARANFTTDMEYEIMDYISDTYCLLFSSNTNNFYKQYKLTIAEGDYDPSITSYINGNGYFKEDEISDEKMPSFLKSKGTNEDPYAKIVPIKFKGLKARLSVIFSKEDTLFYTEDNNCTDYMLIDKIKKGEKLLSGNGPEKVIGYNSDVFITKKI